MMPAQIVADDLVSLSTIADLYDPSIPNNYFEQVYKVRLQAIQQPNKNRMDSDDAENSSTRHTSEASKGIIPPSMFGEKMLYKQGWKGTGYGLGKGDQGMATPLIGEAGTKTQGSITRAPLLVDSSRVIILRNLVGRGQVDEELGSETAAECSAFGTVLHCLIKEEPDEKICTDAEAVRVYVQFDSVAAAERAKSALHNRLFAGRRVLASSYPEAAFMENKYWLPIG